MKRFRIAASGSTSRLYKKLVVEELAAKEPGEGHGTPAGGGRKKVQAPGVPDASWGPRDPREVPEPSVSDESTDGAGNAPAAAEGEA